MLAREKWQNSLTIRDEINKSNKLFQSIRNKKSEVETELRESFEETETLYRTQMKNDFNKEFSMHDEKTALKTQLQNIIRRYDATLSEMTYDVINLDKKYSDIREIYDVFMEKYNSKEKEYLEVLEQMEKEEKTRQEEMLMLFMMNRAARFIQKYWRRYRKDKKKKSKKGKGSKSKRR
ncbi:uncharacterized protein LOC119674525 [Teleopsis dalmanni]|uniref:uncharacterized protein LOC119674525 n=1 Tax=Teleopsis dalmanni TaxID=139649 RepID=UPI0018CCEA42|nr:uncharacterized protein LOC119674525 [Teleopsis dalmanni]